MKKINVAQTAILLTVIIFTPLFAETIYLKSGKRIEGKIIERTNKTIKVEIMPGAAVTYSLDGVERIEEVQPAAVTPDIGQPMTESQGELYVNEEYGFEIRGPKGWFMHTDVGGQKNYPVSFNQSVSDAFATPVLGATIDKIPLQVKTCIDFLNYTLPFQREPVEKAGWQLVVIEQPHEVEVNGIRAARFIFDCIPPEDKKAPIQRNMQYVFMKNDKTAISLMCLASGVASFEKHKNTFEQAINSFRFISLEYHIAEIKKLSFEFKPLTHVEEWQTLKKWITESMSKINSYKGKYILRDNQNEKLAQNDYIDGLQEITFEAPDRFEVYQILYSLRIPGQEKGGAVNRWRVIEGKLFTNPLGGWIESPEPEEDNKEFGEGRRGSYKKISFKQYAELLNTLVPIEVAHYNNQYTILKFASSPIDEESTQMLIWVLDRDSTIRLVQINYDNSRSEEYYFSSFNVSFSLSKPETIFDSPKTGKEP